MLGENHSLRLFLMHYNPKNEKPDTMSKGVTKGNKIWSVNTEIP